MSKQVRMLSVSMVLLLLLSIILTAGMAPPAEASPPGGFAPGQILVRFHPDATASEIAAAHVLNRGQTKKMIERIGVHVVRVKKGEELRAVERYRNDPNVLYAEVDGIVRAAQTPVPPVLFVPNDPMLGQQWGLARVAATAAWGVTRSSIAIRIAILDTGIDAEHGDIRNKVVAARNFTRSRTLNDIFNHGTHVAGIAAAVTNNARGIAGLGFNAALMNVKVLGDDGSGTWSGVANGIIWAADNGAHVINMSLGAAGGHSTTLEHAVNHAWGRGAVLVAAAGNNNSDFRFYPAAYDNVIAVAATDRNDVRASFSNFGAWVDVAAPGVDILSTIPRLRRTDRYGLMSGTSMASPHVAGLAALVWTTGWGTSNATVRDRIQATVDPISPVPQIGGRINAARAVGAIPMLVP